MAGKNQFYVGEIGSIEGFRFIDAPTLAEMNARVRAQVPSRPIQAGEAFSIVVAADADRYWAEQLR